MFSHCLVRDNAWFGCSLGVVWIFYYANMMIYRKGIIRLLLNRLILLSAVIILAHDLAHE